MPSHGIIGRPGAGKTYVCAAIARRALGRGWPVFANFHIDGVTRFGIEDLLDLPAGYIFLDEASSWFHSRKWQHTGDRFLSAINQTRKVGWELFVATQNEKNLDSTIRRNLQYGWLLEARWKSLSWYDPETWRARSARVEEIAADPYGRAPGVAPRVPLSMVGHPLYIYGRRWDFEVFRSQRKGQRPLERRRWWWNWDVARSYDTKEIIQARSLKEVEDEAQRTNR